MDRRVGRDKDIEKVIENIIYQQLIHDGYKVQVGQLQAGEIDFVCTKGRVKKQENANSS